MRKLYLCLFLLCCSIVAVAQIDATNLFHVTPSRPADDIMHLEWTYQDVAENTSFLITKYQTVGAETTEVPTLELRVANVVLPEDETLDGNTVFSCNLYGLDKEGQTSYKFSIKAITQGENQTTEHLVYVSDAGDVATLQQATTYICAYGLTTPIKSNEKSSSVTLTWENNCSYCDYEGEPDVYTIFDAATHKTITSTVNKTDTITNLIPGETYRFFVRAYKGSTLVSTSPTVTYTPVPVDCITFTTANKVDNKHVELQILGYGDDVYTSSCVYTLYNGNNEGYIQMNNNGIYTFQFEANIDVNKPFKLVTAQNALGHRAIGIFELKDDGSAIETQYCDIEFDMQVTHETQHTATITWTDPGFTPTTATLEIINLDDNTVATVTENIPNPVVRIYSFGNLEHSTKYKLVLRLTDGYNQAKKETTLKTKVGSICELEDSQAGSTVGCGGNTFIAPYDVEFYTQYDDVTKKPYVTIRFKLDSDFGIEKVRLMYTTDRNWLADLLNMKTKDMQKDAEGWYSCDLTSLGGNWITSEKELTDGMGMYFAVLITPTTRCSFLSSLNFYATKSVAYKVGVGCQDDAVFSILEFEKVYDRQTQFTLQTNGRMASIGVFPEEAYHPDRVTDSEDEKFDIDKRIYYNSFDDAPSNFTLDISDPVKYPAGKKYYLHIHDVYGEAGDLKYLWAIY